MGRALVLGASGAIGGAIVRRFAAAGMAVLAASRRGAAPEGASASVAWDPLNGQALPTAVAEGEAFDAVVWAQGANANDSVYDVDLARHRALYDANCTSILASLQALLAAGRLARGARLVVISSIWQNIARQNKLSYCMSKAALQGLVMSASVDLARDGILINAVLPGALDTPMTHANVPAESLARLQNATYFHKLATLDDVSNLAWFLCSPDNTGITGQFIAADLGFSHVRLL